MCCLCPQHRNVGETTADPSAHSFPLHRRSWYNKYPGLEVCQVIFRVGGVTHPAGRGQSRSILLSDCGVLSLGDVGAFISSLFQVGVPRQGVHIGWEVGCCIMTSAKKEKAVLYNGVYQKPCILRAKG